MRSMGESIADYRRKVLTNVFILLDSKRYVKYMVGSEAVHKLRNIYLVACIHGTRKHSVDWHIGSLGNVLK